MVAYVCDYGDGYSTLSAMLCPLIALAITLCDAMWPTVWHLQLSKHPPHMELLPISTQS